MMRMSDYLAIPAVSSGLLQDVIDFCPRAAWWRSPWNPNRPKDDTAPKDAGTIAHAIVLESSEACCEVIDPEAHRSKPTKDYPDGNIPDGWTNNAIKGARDLARIGGKIPVLKPAMLEIRDMVAATWGYIESLKDEEPAVWAAFQPGGGDSEFTMEWLDIPDKLDQMAKAVPCKARADRISTDRRLIVDLKFSAVSAEPGYWGRTQLNKMGYYRGAAWYRRAVQKILSVECEYLFLVTETSPPYLSSLVGVDPPAMDLGMRENAMALKIWRECMRTGKYPGYPTRAAYPELPAYKEMAFAERELDEVWTKGLGSQP